jgi:hypothetical protein
MSKTIVAVWESPSCNETAYYRVGYQYGIEGNGLWEAKEIKLGIWESRVNVFDTAGGLRVSLPYQSCAIEYSEDL